MEIIKEFFNNYFNGDKTQGTIRFICDVILVVVILCLFFYFIRQKINVKKLVLIIIGCVVLCAIAIIFKLYILLGLIKYALSWIVGLLVIIYAPEIKQAIDGKQEKFHNDNQYNSKKEKEEVISLICSTVEYLSKRRIGALITFERKDSLESLIDKAITIDSFITQEILTTIFTPGTACHDGGVIIRNNKIACAGAYYPLSDNYDVPKFLGTRHRAAIGISEKYDAITIVVSEETGNISITIAGNINLELTTERVAILLDGYLSVK